MNTSRKSLLALLGIVSFVAAQMLVPRAGRALSDNAAPVPERAGGLPGYGAAFDARVKQIGPITPDEFARRYPGKANYLAQMTWDPTSAKFWDEFAKVPPRDNPRGWVDFRLNDEETAQFRRNGFVVSERLGTASPTDAYYRVFVRDLPVFVTSDSVLHAWHRSYDAVLEEIETTYLALVLNDLLTGMAGQVPAAQQDYGKGVLGDSLTDADYFLAVARSLLAGKEVKEQLDQKNRVADTLTAAAGLQLQDFDLFGRQRKVDFSQFKPRGHYEKSEELRRYFRAMMWCGRIDLRVAAETSDAASPRELGAAIVLNDLLRRAGKVNQWQQFDALLQTFVGQTDSMTFDTLNELLTKAGVCNPKDVRDLAVLSSVQKEALAGKYGVQQIRSHHFRSDPRSPEKVELPRSFTVLGQKFVVDSWVTAKVVYDDVLWNDRKVMRRVPSCLDVAFAALGNDAVVPELTARMKDADGHPFRDGLNYQHNLAATRDVIDQLEPAAWNENLYTSWLRSLRELSVPTTDARYPEAMRTRAWSMKTLNTQMASWTQLRHDTVLYAKQSYTAEVSCFYPAGYVEPVPAFWERMNGMATLAAQRLEATPFPNGQFKVRYGAFFRHFATQMKTLKAIAEKELAQEELTKEETKFLKETVQVAISCGGPRRYTGWYPSLFFSGGRESDKWDALVADVHTDVPSPVVGDPGCVLHQGVGNVDLLVIAVDNGKDRVLYAGPVLSHYEFEMPGTTRKSDSEWRKDINEGKLPPRPAWTKSYLVPGVNPEAKNYKGN